MKNREALSLLRQSMQGAAMNPLLGQTLGPISALYHRGVRAINIYRLPIESYERELQNAQGQFFWLDGWSHPNGGDLQ